MYSSFHFIHFGKNNRYFRPLVFVIDVKEDVLVKKIVDFASFDWMNTFIIIFLGCNVGIFKMRHFYTFAR